MRYFAQIDDNNAVIRVLTVDGEKSSDWLATKFGGTWLETSMDGSIRKNYAGIGMHYDSSLDAFIPKKPFDSWVLDSETAKWEAPVPYPNDGNLYSWDEEAKNWTLFQ